MSSTVSPTAWLQAALAPPAPASTGGRHRAPEEPESAPAVELLTSEQIVARHGRHAEPEWGREAFDPARDDVDAFDWLGFEAAQD
jgi:hypothetical protein